MSEQWRHAFELQIPPSLRALRADRFREDVSERLTRELVERRTAEFAIGFQAACPFPGAKPEDYTQRVVELSLGERALMGIRVHYFDRSPFVDVVAATAPINAETLPEIYAAAVDSYSVFEPRAVRILAGPEPFSSPGFDLTLDQVFVAGSTAAGAKGGEGVTVVAVEDAESAHAFVREQYVAFFESNPEFADIIVPADVDSIQTCRQTGLAAWVLVHGERAGFIASCREVGALVGGQSVTEEILGRRFRGSGLGVPAQRAFMRALEAERGEQILWGTIDARNHASRITARRAGRPEQAAWHWVRSAGSRTGIKSVAF